MVILHVVANERGVVAIKQRVSFTLSIFVMTFLGIFRIITESVRESSRKLRRICLGYISAMQAEGDVLVLLYGEKSCVYTIALLGKKKW